MARFISRQGLAARWLVPLVLVLAACGGGSDDAAKSPLSIPLEVLSQSPDDGDVGDGANDNGTASDPSADDASPARRGEKPEKPETSERPRSADAAPAMSEFLTAVGTLQIPDGEPGEVSIVAVGRPHEGWVPVIVRNRTSDTLYSVKVTGPARNAAGELIGSGNSLEFYPGVVQPGEWAFGSVLYGLDALPADAQFELSISADTEPGYVPKINVHTVELTKTSANYSDQIIGIVENNTGRPLTSGITVAGLCFDATGTTPHAYYYTYAARDGLEVGGTTSFSIIMFDKPECDVYVTGASTLDL